MLNDLTETHLAHNVNHIQALRSTYDNPTLLRRSKHLHRQIRLRQPPLIPPQLRDRT